MAARLFRPDYRSFAFGSQDGKGGKGTSGVNKMLNTRWTAAGVTKTGGAPTDDFGEASLPKGLFSELKARAVERATSLS